MAVNDHANAGALPCGTLLDDLIAQITEGTPPSDRVHQATCRYCQAALAAIRDAWDEFQAMARSVIAIPEGVVDRVMQRIRPLMWVGGDGVALISERGATRIAGRALARLSGASARSVADVAVATVLRAEADPERAGAVAVELRLVVAFGPPVAEVADRVRERVVADLRSEAGVETARVDISIDDVVAIVQES
jgi:uncharacterized alkaline shock family protein YloU